MLHQKFNTSFFKYNLCSYKSEFQERNNHKSMGTKIKKNYCKFCGKTIIGNLFNFKSHLYLHNAVKPRFICKHCLKGYFRYDMYHRHLSTHEGLETPMRARNIFICDYCDRGFMDKRNLANHLRLHDDSVAQSMTRFTCQACGADFCEKRVLVNHIRRDHFSHSSTDKPLLSSRRVNESWYESVVKSNICVQMTKINTNIISIKKCASVKKEIKPMNNLDKPKTVLCTDNYTIYSKAICDYCNREMLKKSILGHIRERHLKIRNFKCEECKRSFNRRYQMTEHVCGKVKRKRAQRSESVLKSEKK